MENKKDNGKTIIIVVLVLLVLGLSGYITYDKFIFKDNTTTELEEKVKQLNKTIDVLKQESTTNEQQTESTKQENTTENNYINAVYYGYSDNAASDNYPKEFLTLFDNGKFVELFVDSEGNSGTYEINNNKLIIHRDAANGPSTGDSTYEISQDKTQIKTENLTLKKMN